jgi:trimeric autotransporter adhesin
MNDFRWILAAAVAAMVGLFAAERANATTLDRNYRMGDDAGEAGSNGGVAPANGGSVTVLTRDSQGVAGQAQLIHLQQVNTPTWRTITGRPDGVGGFGVEFNAAQQEYFHGSNLNDPGASVSHVLPGATLNYFGIVDRGLQFWARPTSTAVQTLVMDSNQHGARIDAGKFSMRYANQDFASNVTVVPNTWYHIEVVRPNTFTNGSRMYVNGVAVAAVAPLGYNDDSSHLTVGANTAGDNTTFTGGTAEFYSGIIDDLKLFVIGSAAACVATCEPDRPAANYGSFNFATDNDYADFILTGVPGDLNHSGSLTQADKDAFIAGWMNKKVINGVQIGDLETFGNGDLNFDGITNIFDLAAMQGALAGAGMGGITEAELLGATVPEPTSLVIVLSTALIMSSATRRGRGR